MGPMPGRIRNPTWMNISPQVGVAAESRAPIGVVQIYRGSPLAGVRSIVLQIPRPTGIPLERYHNKFINTISYCHLGLLRRPSFIPTTKASCA